MEVLAFIAATQALVFVIAFGATLAVRRARVVLIAGVVIVVVSAIVLAVAALGVGGEWVWRPWEVFIYALAYGFFLYVGWWLGVVAATRAARSWAARRG